MTTPRSFMSARRLVSCSALGVRVTCVGEVGSRLARARKVLSPYAMCCEAA